MNTRVLALLLLAAVFLAGCPQPPPVPIDKEPPSLEQQTSTFDPLARCRSLSYSKQQECITEVAVQGAYPSLCDELDAKNRTKCLRDTAIQARNPEFCRGIQQIATRNVCYKTIALLTEIRALRIPHHRHCRRPLQQERLLRRRGRQNRGRQRLRLPH